jgi:hypothetical protein
MKERSARIVAHDPAVPGKGEWHRNVQCGSGSHRCGSLVRSRTGEVDLPGAGNVENEIGPHSHAADRVERR